MPWSGTGIFTRIYSWISDDSAGINITASRMDTDTNDIVTAGLGNCITRDGQGSATANQPMNGFRHTGASVAVGTGDYVTYGQLTGATGSVTSAKTTGGFVTTGHDAGDGDFRTINGNYGAFIRNDGTDVYLLQTASGSQTGTYNIYRPFFWALSNGAVTIDGTNAGTTIGGYTAVKADGGTYAISISGNATTASTASTASSANAVAWGNVSGKPYSFNQSTDTGSSPTFAFVTATAGPSTSGSGYYFNSASTITAGAWGPLSIGFYTTSGVLAFGYFTSSDKRQKSDIKLITPEMGVNWVCLGKPVKYIVDGRHSAGFIAQDEFGTPRVESVQFHKDDRPEFADGDGFAQPGVRLSRDYQHDIAYLTAALQAAFNRITALEARL